MTNLPARRRVQPMLSPPVPDVIPANWLDRIGTVWSLGPHPVAVKNQARAVLEQIAPFSEQVGEELVRAWVAPVIASVSNPRPAEQIDPYIAADADPGRPARGGLHRGHPARPVAPLHPLASGGRGLRGVGAGCGADLGRHRRPATDHRGANQNGRRSVMNMQPDIDDLFPGSTVEPPEMGELTPTLIEGELRIRDVDLAARLGFARPTNIRQLIERHRESLSKISVLHTVVQTPSGQGGRPTIAYYLNRKQALFIIAKSDMPKAVEITIYVIELFDAYDRDFRSVRPDHPILTPEDCNAIGGIVKRGCAAQIRPLAQMRAVDHSHIVALKQHVVGLTEHVVTLAQEVAALKAAPVAETVKGEVFRQYWPMKKILKAHGIGHRGRGRLVHR
jgi:hypothetical protein